MKLYEESLINSKVALASTKPLSPDIKLSAKDLSIIKKVQKSDVQSGTVETHTLGILGWIQGDYLFE